jgi:hypothetical protein
MREMEYVFSCVLRTEAKPNAFIAMTKCAQGMVRSFGAAQTCQYFAAIKHLLMAPEMLLPKQAEFGWLPSPSTPTPNYSHVTCSVHPGYPVVSDQATEVVKPAGDNQRRLYPGSDRAFGAADLFHRGMSLISLPMASV